MRIQGYLFFPLWSTVALASAQVGIRHDALTCMSTNEFPVVEAELPPAEFRAVREAQVYFKANGSDAWYFVDMEPGEGSQLRAMLPRPLAETNRVDYYVFVLSGTFESWQTEEYSVYVTESDCGGVRAATGAPASLTLRATVANQTPVPPGFQPTGISGLVTTSGNTVAVGSAAAAGGGASGGVSGMTIGLVAAGGAAAAAGAVVATGGSGENDGGANTSPSASSPVLEGNGTSTSSSPPPSSTPAPAPSPAPSPEPSLPDVAGTWILNDRLTESCDPALVGRTSTTGMVIRQNGSALTASREGPNFTENLTGTIDATGNLSMRGPFSDEGETGESQWDATTTSGEEMTGRYSRFYPAHDCTLRWTFTGQKQ